MNKIESKFDVESLRRVKEQLDDIQGVSISDKSDDSELASVLDNVTRTANMLCDIIEQHLKGNISTNEPLAYIQNKMNAAYNTAMQIDKRRS